MKKLHVSTVLLIFFMAAILPGKLSAQCNCTPPDPFGYASTSCGLQSLTIQGNSATCIAAGCNASSGSYTYEVYFASNVVTGYAYLLTGGVANTEIITRGNGMSQVTRQTCSNYGQYGSVNFINHLTIKINWTTASTGNCLKIWGYTGGTGFPTTITYFNFVTISTANGLPAAPTSISISSPTSFPVCGWKMACSYIPNADTYTWTGAANITTPFYSGGATVAENQNAFLCVKANNSCGSSSTYCTTVSIPNNTMCGSRLFTDPNSAADKSSKLITGNDFGNEILITPNPATTSLSVLSGKYEIRSIELFTTTGQLVQHIMPSGNKRQDINISNLRRGLYMVLIHQVGAPDFKKMIVLQ